MEFGPNVHRCCLFVSVLGTTHLAQEALAGLASTEDFSNVTLRKTDASSRSAVSEYLPYNDVMLLHVKGKWVTHSVYVIMLGNSSLTN